MKKLILLILITPLLDSCTNQTNSKHNNAVSTAHPIATETAIEIYKKGGNAADAAVAAAFILSVAEPSMSGIGGRLQAIIYHPNKGINGIDASTQVPKNFKENNNERDGYGTIGIPGVVAGLLKLHNEYGILPLEELISPAIKLAEDGLYLLPGEVERQTMALQSLLKFEGSKATFLKNDLTNYSSQELFKQPNLAKVLHAIKERGFDGFYKGEIAEEIVRDNLENGGYLTIEDLATYKAENSKIVTGTYKGHRVYSLYLPSYGAITINLLQILDFFDLNLNAPFTEINIISKAISKSYEMRQYQRDSLEKILSKEFALKIADEIKKDKPISNKLNLEEPEIHNSTLGHTSHLTTADENGMVISLTQTIGPNMGSKVASRNLGFLYAVTMGGYLGKYKPGDRANSHISPTLLLNENNELVMAIGAAGGSRIVTAITEVVKNYLDLNLTIEESVARSRVYPQVDTLWIEAHKGIIIDSKLLDSLSQAKIKFKLQNSKGFFGRINAITLEKNGKNWKATTDPDWEGKSGIYPE